MNEQEIKAKRKALSDKAAALKELMEIGEITYDQYSQEIAKIQIERRKLKNASVIDVEVVSVDESKCSDDLRSALPVIRTKPPQWSAEWWQQASPEVQVQRCKAKNTKGDRCQRISVSGSRVCYTHGGAAPQVKRAAMARLENAADRMARNLLGLADDAESENVRLSATNSALDRVGIKSATEVVLSAGAQSGFDEVMEDLEFSTMTRAESRAARGIENHDIDGLEPLSHNGCGATNLVASQAATLTAPAMSQQGERREHGPSEPSADERDAPRPSHRQAAKRPRERQRGPVIQGEAAIIAANRANEAIGALRALPRGRE